MTTPQPTGPPPIPTDRFGTPIRIGASIVYGAGDGYLLYGVVGDLIHKWAQVHYLADYAWQTRVKVVNADGGFSNLTKLTNVIVVNPSTEAAIGDKIRLAREKRANA